jgi:hypothetical protein
MNRSRFTPLPVNPSTQRCQRVAYRWPAPPTTCLRSTSAPAPALVDGRKGSGAEGDAIHLSCCERAITAIYALFAQAVPWPGRGGNSLKIVPGPGPR